METKVTELENSRDQIAVTVDPAEIKDAIVHMAGHLGEDMKVPGFRKGKVPPEVVVQRLGREAILPQAIEHTLGGGYEQALLDADVSPVGDPKLNVPELPGDGEPLNFSIEV